MVKRLAVGDPLTELLRLLRKVLVGEVLRLILLFDAVDLANNRPQFLQLPFVFCPKKILQQIHTWVYYTKKSSRRGENPSQDNPPSLAYIWKARKCATALLHADTAVGQNPMCNL